MNRAIRTALLATVSLAVLMPAVPAHAAKTTGELMVTQVRPNAAGADIKNGKQINLNDEFFVIKNVTKKTVNVGGWVPDITTNTFGRALPSYKLPAGASARVHTGAGKNHKDSKGVHHIYRGYARHVLPNDGRSKTPNLRLKKPGSKDNNAAAGTISACSWSVAANGRTYSC
ncbi:lamin tail domain-containing protein [Streptomyces spiramenti]